MRVLPDTSVWINYLRRGREGEAHELDGLLERNQVIVAGPVVAEILAGARAGDRGKLWDVFQALPWAPIDAEGWRQVGETAALLRESGSVVPLTDVEIAVSAVAAEAALWTRDTDFSRIVHVLSALSLYSPSAQ